MRTPLLSRVHVDHEPVPRLLRDDLHPSLVDAQHRDLLNLGLDVAPSTEVDHLLRLADPSRVRAGERIALQHEAHLPDVDGVYGFADTHSAVGRISLQERNEAVE